MFVLLSHIFSSIFGHIFLDNFVKFKKPIFLEFPYLNPSLYWPYRFWLIRPFFALCLSVCLHPSLFVEKIGIPLSLLKKSPILFFANVCVSAFRVPLSLLKKSAKIDDFPFFFANIQHVLSLNSACVLPNDFLHAYFTIN